MSKASEKDQLRVCFVYLKPIDESKKDFSTIVPIRMANVLKGASIKLHLIYSGKINTEKLQKNGISYHCYNGFFNSIPFLRYIGLILFQYVIGRREKISIFMNVWEHYLLGIIWVGARLCCAKVVARVAGVPIQKYYGKNIYRIIRNRLGLWFESLSLYLADGIHVLSNSLAQIVQSRGGDITKINVISQGVDTNQFCISSHKKLTHKVWQLLFVGRLVPNKCVDDIIHAVAILVHDTNLNIELLIVGHGPAGADLQELSSMHSIENKVRFLGYVPHEQLTRLYHSADVLVIASQSEGLPNVILESQACGLPVVATEVGGIPELLQNGHGFLVPIKNPDAIASAIKCVLENTTKRKQCISKAYDFVLKEHSLTSVREKYLNMFNNCLRKG
jgi:glycosyltransferase involved in cell wall biosynthesis